MGGESFYLKMTVIGDIGIKELLDKDSIVYHPRNDEMISGNSIDFTLGNYYYKCSNDPEIDILNPSDAECTEKYFNDYEKAITHKEWLARNLGREAFKNIDLETPIIVLQPGERILAHTYEFIGTAANESGQSGLSGEIRATSSLARYGVQICSDSSHIDPGFSNRITLELYNMNKKSIALQVGRVVGKIVFQTTGPIDKYYGKDSNYQNSNNMTEIIKNWKPQDMLPKPYNKKLQTTPIPDLNPEYQL